MVGTVLPEAICCRRRVVLAETPPSALFCISQISTRFMNCGERCLGGGRPKRLSPASRQSARSKASICAIRLGTLSGCPYSLIPPCSDNPIDRPFVGIAAGNLATCFALRGYRGPRCMRLPAEGLLKLRNRYTGFAGEQLSQAAPGASVVCAELRFVSLVAFLGLILSSWSPLCRQRPIPRPVLSGARQFPGDILCVSTALAAQKSSQFLQEGRIPVIRRSREPTWPQ